MNLRTVIATATTAAVLATAGVAIAGAATGTSSGASGATGSSGSSAPVAVVETTVTNKPATPSAHPARRHLRVRRALRRGAAKVVTQTVNIDRKTLRSDLLAGQTIAQIATAHGVAPQTVIDALVTAATTKVNAAAQHGLITSARAARIEQRLPARATKFVDTWLPKRARTTTSTT